MGTLKAKVNGAWEDIVSKDETVPPGGTTSQVLAKRSDTDHDAGWADLVVTGGLPLGGTTNQVLGKASAADQDAHWEDSQFPPVIVTSANGDTLTTPGLYRISGTNLGLPTYATNTALEGLLRVYNSSDTLIAQTWYSGGNPFIAETWSRFFHGGNMVWTPWVAGPGMMSANDFDATRVPGVYLIGSGGVGGPPVGASTLGILTVDARHAGPVEACVQTWTSLDPALPFTQYGRIRTDAGIWIAWAQITPVVAAGGGIPDGGTTGQVLAKVSDTDQDADWADSAGGFPLIIDVPDGTAASTLQTSGLYRISINDLDTLPTQIYRAFAPHDTGILTVYADAAGFTQSWQNNNANTSSTYGVPDMFYRSWRGNSWGSWVLVNASLQVTDFDDATVVGTYLLNGNDLNGPGTAKTGLLVVESDIPYGTSLGATFTHRWTSNDAAEAWIRGRVAGVWTAWSQQGASAGGGLPDGGATGQVLGKRSNTDQDAVWGDSAFPPVLDSAAGVSADLHVLPGLYRITGMDAGLPADSLHRATSGILRVYAALNLVVQTWHGGGGNQTADVWTRSSDNTGLGWTVWSAQAGGLTLSDFNLATAPGVYPVPTTGLPNAPITGEFGILVVDANNGPGHSVVQTWTNNNPAKPFEQWVRVRDNGTVWGAWAQGTGPAGPAGPPGADSTVPGPAGADGAPGVDGDSITDVALDTTIVPGESHLMITIDAQPAEDVGNVMGPEGPVGPGVAPGGTTGQILLKNSDTDYDTSWSEFRSTLYGSRRITSADDLDSLPTTGYYDWINNSMPVNGPETAPSSGFLNHFFLGDGGSFQIQHAYVPTNNGLHHWTRQRVSGTWSAWTLDTTNVYGRWLGAPGSSDIPPAVFDEKLMTATTFQVGGIARDSGRIKVPFKGKYLITLNGSIQAATGGGIRQMCLGVNGATNTEIYQVINGVAASYAWYTSGSGIIALEAGDMVSMFLYQSSGSTPSTGNCWISMSYLGS